MSSACFLWPCWPGIWGWAVGNIWCVCCIVMEFFSKGKQNWFSSIYFFLNQSWIFTFSIVWTARRAQSESGSLSSFCVTGQLFFILSDYLHISVCSHRPLIDHICLHPGIRLFFFFFSCYSGLGLPCTSLFKSLSDVHCCLPNRQRSVSLSTVNWESFGVLNKSKHYHQNTYK